MPGARELIQEHLSQYRLQNALAIGEAADMNSDTWETHAQAAESALKGARTLAERYFPDVPFDTLMNPDA